MLISQFIEKNPTLKANEIKKKLLSLFLKKIHVKIIPKKLKRFGDKN